MGATRRGIFASAGALAAIVALAGCSALYGSGAMTNARSAGLAIGASAATAAPTPTSTNPGWVDTTGCPSGLYQGFVAGLGSNASASQSTPSTSSGPTAFPTLTSQYVPSCAFDFVTNGVSAKAEVFVGMDESYEQGFAARLTQAGYVVATQSGNYTYYRSGSSLIGLGFVSESENGVLIRAVAVVSANQ